MKILFVYPNNSEDTFLITRVREDWFDTSFTPADTVSQVSVSKDVHTTNLLSIVKDMLFCVANDALPLRNVQFMIPSMPVVVFTPARLKDRAFRKRILGIIENALWNYESTITLVKFRSI